jgi:DNA-binding NarL/FixJ family response regulator
MKHEAVWNTSSALGDAKEMVQPCRILVVSANLEVRRSLVEAFEDGGFCVSAVASTSEDFADDVGLILVDLALRDVDAIDLVRRIARRNQPVPVLAIGARGDDARIIAAIRAGVHGCIYVDDPRERFVGAAKEALDGGLPLSRGMAHLLIEHVRRLGRHASAERRAIRPLTEREQVVLRQMARGQRYEDIGCALGVSLNTVRSYVRSVYEKLDVSSRTEAVLVGMKLGIVAGTPYPTVKPRR